MTARRQPRMYDRWAQLRFSVVGQLLADPPAKGTLQSEINKLSLREWRHPATGEPGMVWMLDDSKVGTTKPCVNAATRSPCSAASPARTPVTRPR